MNVGTRASKRPAKDAIGMLAPSIVGTLNFCVVTSFGQECALTPLEANFLVPSMQRMLERMPAAAAQRAGIIIDPLVIVTVLIMWARRIGQVQDQKAKEKYVIRPEEQARANGVAGTVHSVDANAARQQSVPTPQSYPTSAEPPPPSASGIPPEILGSFDNATF